MSQESEIRIIRFQHSFNIISSCIIEIQLRLTMFIPKDVNFYIYPFTDYLPDLRVKLDSKEVSILSYNQLSEILGSKVEPDLLVSTFVEKFNLPPDQSIQNIAVIKIPEHQDCYKEVILEWKESIEYFRKKSGITFSIPLYRYFNPGLENASMYVSISVDEKFELSKVRVRRHTSEIYHYFNGDHMYEGFKDLVDKFEYDTILIDKRRCVFRIPRNFFDVIKVDFEIKIPTMITLWLFLGMLIGSGIELAVLFSSSFSQQHAAPVLGVTFAGLIALRFVLFHDLELLKLWNYLYLILIGVIVATLAMQIFISLR